VDAKERLSWAMRFIKGLLKAIVLVLCVPLRRNEGRDLYISLRAFFDSMAHDFRRRPPRKYGRPMRPTSLLTEGLHDIWDARPDIGMLDLDNTTVYRFLNVPMKILVGYALPGALLIGLVASAAGANRETVTLVVVVAAAALWSLAAALHVRWRINLDLDPPERKLSDAGDPNRLLTGPNLLSASRLLLGGPLFIYFVVINNHGAAMIVVLLAGISDWADGHLARLWGQVTFAGRVLDRGADRLFMLAMAGSFLMAGGPVPIWLMALLFVRESLVSGLSVTFWVLGADPVEVDWRGKVGCALVMAGMTVMLIPSLDAGWLHPEKSVGMVIGYLGAGTTLVGVIFKYVAMSCYAKAVPKAIRT